jgi:hypothetical protein
VNIYFVSLYLHGHTKNKKWLIHADCSCLEEIAEIEKYHCFPEARRGAVPPAKQGNNGISACKNNFDFSMFLVTVFILWYTGNDNRQNKNPAYKMITA